MIWAQSSLNDAGEIVFLKQGKEFYKDPALRKTYSENYLRRVNTVSLIKSIFVFSLLTDFLIVFPQIGETHPTQQK